MEEQLIEAVRRRPGLFDKQTLMYRNRLAKERAWKSVAQVVGVSVKQCMGRWRSLRDRYVREISKAKDPDSVGRPSWRYFKQLAFIEQHVNSRRRLSNLDHTAETEEHEPAEFTFSEIVKDSKSNTFQLEIKRPDPDDSYENECEEEEMEEDILPMLHEMGRVETPPPPPPPRPDTPPRKRQKMQETAHERFEKLCSAVTDLIESKKQTYHKKSRNEDFYKVLDGYLLKLSEDEQDDLKIRILNMVHVNPLD